MTASTTGSETPDLDAAADQAAPLDALLVDAALGPLRRLAPNTSTARFAARLARRPRTTLRRLTGLAGELARVGAGTSTLTPSRRDRRFTDPAWAENPLLRRLLQAYLAAGQTLQQLAADADLGWRDDERVAVQGNGRPLLVLTGIGASLELGGPFARALHPFGIQTIAVDALGTGKSDPYPRPRRMPGLARTVECTLDALGYQRVDLLGVSFGGVLAQQLAHQAPHRVRRLVLAATGPGLGGVPGSPRALLALATPRRHGSPDYYRRIAGTLYGGAARRDPDALLHGSVTRFTEPRRCAATWPRSTRSPAGRACPGCGGCRSPRSSSPGTTTRSSRSPTGAS
ncbi:MAG TPA: alpha/beta fold hydrolase [Mycobacteriales bacterium]